MALHKEAEEIDAREIYYRFRNYQIRNRLSDEEFKEVLRAIAEGKRATVH